MKTTVKMILVLFMVMMVSFDGYALESAKDLGLSDDPRLERARESFEIGQDYMEKGYNEVKRRAGHAQKLFEHAEDYYAKAGFLYKEIGEIQGIDVSHEVAVCARKDRQAHVMVNKARKKGARNPK